jgi:hypothetical protein
VTFHTAFCFNGAASYASSHACNVPTVSRFVEKPRYSTPPSKRSAALFLLTHVEWDSLSGAMD